MSSIAVTPSASSTIDLNDPRLHTPYIPHVSHNPTIRAMSEHLCAHGSGAAGHAATNCGRYAAVYQRNLRRKLARAYRFVCFLWICEYCGTAHNLLRGWLKDRNWDVTTVPQSGLRISSTSHQKAEAAARRLAAHLWHKYHIDSIRRPEVPNGTVRMVLKTRTLSLSMVKEVLGRGIYADLRHDGGRPLDTLRWLFASTEDVLRIEDGQERARLYTEWQRGKRMLKTAGKFYSPVKLTTEERAERMQTLSAQEIAEGWEEVPLALRHVETVEHISETYIAVEWKSSYDPFAQGRVRHMAPNMNKCNGRHIPFTEISVMGASPPS